MKRRLCQPTVGERRYYRGKVFIFDGKKWVEEKN